MIKDQSIFSSLIILLILITYLLTMHKYPLEKIVVGHCWDLKGLTNGGHLSVFSTNVFGVLDRWEGRFSVVCRTLRFRL